MIKKMEFGNYVDLQRDKHNILSAANGYQERVRLLFLTRVESNNEDPHYQFKHSNQRVNTLRLLLMSVIG
jgi:hypothetical protein